MANLFGVLLILAAVVVFVLCLVGLVKPSFLKRAKAETPPSRLKILLAGLLLPFLMFGLGGAFLDTSGTEATNQAQVVQQQAPLDVVAAPIPESAPTAALTMGVTPEEFRKSYNDVIGQIDRSWRVPEFDVTQGSVNDTFTAKLGGAASIVGTIDKPSKQLKSVMVIAGGGQGKDNMQTVAVLMGIVHSLAQSSSKEEINKAVTSVMNAALDGMNDANAKSQSVVLGNRKLSATASPITGLMFSVGVAD